MIRSNPRRRILYASLIAVALILSACGNSKTRAAATTTTAKEPSGFAGYVRTPALNVASVTLPKVDGTPVNMVASPNGFRLVYFGFATCPDVCPMTLGHVKVALADLPQADRDRVQVDVITVDPSRDTPDRWPAYVEQFVATANPIRTEDPYLLRSSAAEFGVEYRISLDSEGKRQVSHTDDLYVIDDTGTIVLAWPFGTSGPDIERDLLRLLAGDRPSEDS